MLLGSNKMNLHDELGLEVPEEEKQCKTVTENCQQTVSHSN